MLEESGYRINKPKVVATPRKYVMSQRWQDASLAKRGTRFTGVRNAIVNAELGKRDMSRYNREGDAMRGLRLYPLKDVAQHMSWYARRMNRYADPDDWAQAWSQEDLRAAQELTKELKRRSG